jgi:hypothetical protein
MALPRLRSGTIVPLLVFAATCITVGILWDISWHVTIGRDSFWTPAHMAIYLGGTLGGVLAGGLVLQSTFWHRDVCQGESVGILGLRAPLGAWVAAWGAAAMLTSAPLDDWWHNAYGLDVKILSPPHALLAAGMYGVVTGAVLLAAAARNQATSAVGAASVPSRTWVILAMGIQLTLASVLLTEVSFPNLQHTGTFFLASAILYPAFLTAAARYAPAPGAATRIALVYLGLAGAMVWILPLFPAEPKLAPVYHRVTHMTPPAFPLMLVAPALALDVLYHFTRSHSGRAMVLVRIGGAALLFVAVFVPAQWYFAEFLVSPAADNPFFAGHGRFLGYMARRTEWRELFWRVDRDPVTALVLGKMLLITLASCAFGHSVGAWFQRVRR